MNYGDWRDNINPDLLYRYWLNKGSPGLFIQNTKYGVQILRRHFAGLGELRILNSPMFGNTHKLLYDDRNLDSLLNWRPSGG